MSRDIVVTGCTFVAGTLRRGADLLQHACCASAPPPLVHSEHVTHVPAEQFDALTRSLDVPDDAPGLRRAAVRRRGSAVCA